MKPAKTRSVAWPRSRGPSAISVTLPTPSTTTAAALNRSGAIRREQPLRGRPEGHRLLADHAAAHRPAAGHRGRWRRSARSPSASAEAPASCRLLRAQLGRDDLLVRRVVGEQLVVGAAADDPAVLEHEDLVGVADAWPPAARRSPSRRRGSRARAPRAAGRRWRGRAPRTRRRRGRSPAGVPAPGRSPAAAAGRRRRWCRPARSARRGPRASPRRSRGPGRSRAPATAPRRSRPACRGAGWCATVPVNRNAFCGTSPIRAQSSVGVEVADVDAVDADRAGGRVEEPRHQVDQRGLAGAGRADHGDGLAGPDAGSETSVSTGCSAPG